MVGHAASLCNTVALSDCWGYSQGMTEHRITVDGHTYRFELHPYPSGPKMMVDAPGIVPFTVESLAEARDKLRSVYSEAASK